VIKPEKRKKAIYETVVYESQISGSAEFVLPADIARYGVTREALMLDRAEVRLGISDARGLVDGNSLAVDGTPRARCSRARGSLSTGNSGTFAFVDWSGRGADEGRLQDRRARARRLQADPARGRHALDGQIELAEPELRRRLPAREARASRAAALPRPMRSRTSRWDRRRC
jgi:hypothetical protein